MKTILAIIAFSPLLVSAQFDRVVTVFGEAEMEIEPDEIILSIHLAENENLKKDTELVAQEISLKKTLSEYGIPNEQLTVSNYDASTLGMYGGTSNRYRLSKTYNLNLEDPEIVDDLVVSLFQAGVDRVNFLKLISNDLETHKETVLKNAVEAARQKATVLTAQLGSDLGKVVLIEEYFSAIQDGNHNNFNYNDYGARLYATGAVSRSVAEPIITPYSEPVATRKIVLKKTVMVKFEIQ